MQKFIKKKLVKKNKHLSQRFYIEGKSYKITQKKSILNMRFNKSNKNILVTNHILFFNKGGQKKLYSLNTNLISTKSNKLLQIIRPINTYTLRGFWSE